MQHDTYYLDAGGSRVYFSVDGDAVTVNATSQKVNRRPAP